MFQKNRAIIFARLFCCCHIGCRGSLSQRLRLCADFGAVTWVFQILLRSRGSDTWGEKGRRDTAARAFRSGDSAPCTKNHADRNTGNEQKHKQQPKLCPNQKVDEKPERGAYDLDCQQKKKQFQTKIHTDPPFEFFT